MRFNKLTVEQNQMDPFTMFQGLYDQIEALKEELKVEKRRAIALDKEWQQVTAQKLGGLKGRFKTTFLRELKEIELSLTMQPPSIEIALVHIRRMKEDMEKL